MKKYILLLVLAWLSGLSGYSQGTGGFFNQQQSKVKLMLAQIAGYRTYYNGLKKGHEIAENGLNTVHELKNGSFDLNSSYFTSLEQVNPAVKSSSKVKAIGDLQQQVITLFTTELGWQQKQQILSAGEITYIKTVYQNLLKKCKADQDELRDVTTPGKMQMSDHDRLERIDHIYNSMQDKHAFAASFTAHCRQIATDRKKNRLDNDELKKLYGIGT